MTPPSFAACLVVVSAFTATLSGCSSGPSAAADPALRSPSLLMERLRAGEGKVRTVTGNGTLAFDGPGGSGTAFFSVALRKPDSLLVRLEGPFGLDAGFLFLARDTFVVYSSFENRLILGNPASPNLRTLLPVDLSAEQIVQAFAGGFSPDKTARPAGPLTMEEDRLVLRCETGGGRRTYAVDPATMLVTRFLLFDTFGVLLLDVQSSSIVEQNDGYAPRRISVVLPGSSAALSISYSSITLNDPFPSFAYTVPRNVKPSAPGAARP